MIARDLSNPDQESLFTDEELQQFEADDQSAGTAIARILSTLFVYTLIVMSIALWWTLRTVMQ